MTAEQISILGSELADFLDEFADCFGRSEPRSKLGDYVRGQLSDLPRKSCEPIATMAGIAPRSLQEFLGTDDWDHEQAHQRLEEIVVRDHADPEAIGIVDDSGHPKKGSHTACVQRQYCGRTGKVDNCVITVHLTYSSFDTRFRTTLDSTLYMPRSWEEDAARREQAAIPKEVAYRPKYRIALEQLDRALANGVRFGWVTADEWYAGKPDFLAGLEQRGLRFVAEIPRNFYGWSFWPGPHPQYKPHEVENLVRYSRYARNAVRARFHIKDTEKGPVVWEAMAVPLWVRRGKGIVGPYWLIYARNLTNPLEEKYFLSNAAPGTPLEVLLHVAFARWSIERCLEDQKSELGMSHFEVRKYLAIQRHLLVTQISHLFLARQTQRLRGEKSGHHRVPGPHRYQRGHRHARPAAPASP